MAINPLEEASIVIGADTTKAEAEITKFVAEMRQLLKLTAEVDVDIDRSAMATLQRLDETLARMDYTIVQAAQAVHGLNGTLATTAERMAAVARNPIRSIIPNRARRDVEQTNWLMRALGVSAMVVADRMRRWSGLEVLQEMGKWLNRVTKEMATMMPQIAAASAGIAGLVAIIAQFGAGLAAVVGGIGQLIMGLVALPGALVAGGAAAWVLTAAFSRLAEFAPEISKAFSRIQTAIAGNFWDEARGGVLGVLTALQGPMQTIATSVGKAFNELALAVTDVVDGTRLDSWTAEISQGFGEMARAMRPAVTGLAAMVDVGLANFPRFSAWLTTISEQFSEWARTAAETGKMQDWIDAAVVALGNFASMVGSVVDIFRALFRASEEAGISLSVVAGGLRTVADAMNAPAFQGAMAQVFRDSAEAMRIVSDKAGPAISQFFLTLASILGDSMLAIAPGVGDALDAIAKALGSIEVHDGIVSMMEGFGNMLSILSPAVESLAPLLGKAADGMGALAEAHGEVIATAVAELIPTLEDIMDALTPLIREMGPALADLISALAPVIRVVGDILTTLVIPALTALVSFIGDNADAFATLLIVVGGAVGIFKVVTGVMALFTTATTVLTTAFNILKAAILANPFVALVAAILAVVAGLVYFFTQTELGQRIWEGFVNALSTAWNWLWENGIKPVIDFIVSAWDTAWGIVSGIWENVIQPMIEGISGLFGKIGDAVQSMWDTIEPVFQWFGDAWDTLVSGLQTTWDTIGQPIVDLFVSAWELAGTVVSAIWTGLQGLWDILWSVIKLVWEMTGQVVIDIIVLAFELMVSILSAGWELLQSLWDVLWGAISSAWDAVGQPVVDLIATAFEIMGTGLETVWSGIQTAWDVLWVGVQAAWNTVGQPIVDAVKTAFEILKTGIVTAWNTITTKISGAISSITGFFNILKGGITGLVEKFTNLKNNAQEKIDAVRDLIKGLKDKALEWIGNLGGLLVDAGKNLIQGLIDGIGKGFEKAKTAVSDGLGKLRNLLPFSPPKDPTSPFAGKGYTTYAGRALMSDFAKGIEAASPEVERAMHASLAKLDTSTNLSVAANGGESSITSVGTLNVTLNMDDLAQLRTLDDFLRMVEVSNRMV